MNKYTGPQGIRQFLADSNNVGCEGKYAEYKIGPAQAAERYGLPDASLDTVKGTWVEYTEYDPFTPDWGKFGIDESDERLNEPGCFVEGKVLVICGVTCLMELDTLCWWILHESE